MIVFIVLNQIIDGYNIVINSPEKFLAKHFVHYFSAKFFAIQFLDCLPPQSSLSVQFTDSQETRIDQFTSGLFLS